MMGIFVSEWLFIGAGVKWSGVNTIMMMTRDLIRMKLMFFMGSVYCEHPPRSYSIMAGTLVWVYTMFY